MHPRYWTTRVARWKRAYRGHVWRPNWVGRWARVWRGGVVGLGWPLLLWAASSVLFGLAGHTLRLPLIAAAFGWLATGCCAAAAVLPFVGGGMVLASLFRTAPQAADREQVPRVPRRRGPRLGAMRYVRGHLRDGDGEWVPPRYRTSRRALIGWIAAAASVPLLLATGAALRHVGPAARPEAQPTASSGPAAASATIRVYVEPQAGLSPVYRIIAAARHTVRVAIYELNDPIAEHALAAAARRRVDVLVLLDQNRERSRNQAAFSYLHAHGVRVAWANPHYTASHEKTVTADGRVAAIMTGNLVSRDYPSTRDVLVIDRDRVDVAAIDTTITADLARRPVTPPAGADLVWSPATSQASLLSLLGQARHTLAIENAELDDPEITSALLAALRRHVQVTLVLTSDPRWESVLVQLQAAGARVVELGDTAGTLYIHAKVIAADADTGTARLFVGSQNFTIANLRANRELGIILRARPLVDAIAAVVQADATTGGR